MKMTLSKFINYENILINKIFTNNCVTNTNINPNYYILHIYTVKQLNYWTY